MLKRGLKIILGLFVVLCLLNCKSICYGLQQGMGQLKIVWKAKPLDEYLKDKNYPDSLKAKIKLIEEIKRFAFDSLGIYPSKNYTKMYDQKGLPGMYVVTACEAYALNSYKWSFPILGEFSYKGFFKKKKAVKEAQKLKNEGFDTDIGEVNAWSTLGWFKDPIMSSMLQKTEGQLARLLIHELTHGTIFVKNDVQFNENLASFIGDKGALMFLKNKYPKDSQVIKSYLDELSDLQKIRAHMHRGALQLKKFYKEKGALKPEKEKKVQIHKVLDNMDTLSLNSFHKVRRIQALKHNLNNTFFTDFLMYREDQKQLEKTFNEDFGGDFKLYFDSLKEKYTTL
ncbi:MAG: aminopeptidase [Flavobacteriales bacterium]|nr:aminopeptidase [Flavobacteriales bacterium]MBO72441.1 aminopeptidase [Flavobacteriales bacterium]|tara:strand:- start:5619 stop:6638 length:1020 start_codon:yes stop_codon:yes gene_type:complete